MAAAAKPPDVATGTAMSPLPLGDRGDDDRGEDDESPLKSPVEKVTDAIVNSLFGSPPKEQTVEEREFARKVKVCREFFNIPAWYTTERIAAKVPIEGTVEEKMQLCYERVMAATARRAARQTPSR